MKKIKLDKWNPNQGKCNSLKCVFLIREYCQRPVDMKLDILCIVGQSKRKKSKRKGIKVKEIILIAEAITQLEKKYGEVPMNIIENILVKPLIRLEKITTNDIKEVLEKKFKIKYNSDTGHIQLN